MTREERLSKPCPKNHPLSGRYIVPYTGGRHPNGHLLCRYCDTMKARKSNNRPRTRLPSSAILCFPHIKAAAKQIAAVLHHPNAQRATRWLNGKRAEPWEIRQVIAAMELGLILHPGSPPDPPIPFDPMLDVEPAVIAPQNGCTGQE